MSQEILVGCDPELFLQTDTGKFISSIGLIGGSKTSPLPIDDEGCAIQEDNVAVEYNTPPCKSAEEFVKYNKKVLAEIAQRVGQMGLKIVVTPSAHFDDDQLDSAEAQTFGCEPDFNAWEGCMNERPTCDDANLRSAGGHIHIGNIDGLSRTAVVKAMDLFVGCQMLTFDKDTKRRKLYGKAGAHRPKPYGVEYRTASNAWIESEERMRWVFEQTQKAVQFVREGKEIAGEWAEKVQACINNSDESLLPEINKYFGIVA